MILSRLIKTLFIVLLTTFLLIVLLKNVIFDESKKSTISTTLNHQTTSMLPHNEMNHNDKNRYQNVSDSSEPITLLQQVIVAGNKQYTETQYKAFFVLWMSKEPESVMAYLLNLKDENFRFSMLLLAMTAWSDSDSDALNTWLLTTKTGTTLDFVIVELSQNISISPQLAIQYTEKINEIDLRNKSIFNIIQKWVDTDIFDAVGWVSQNNVAYQQYGLPIYSLVIEEDIDVALSSLYLLSDKDPSITAAIIDAITTKTFQLVSEEGFDADNIALALLSLPHNDFNDTIIEAILPLILSHSTTDNTISLIDNISNDEVRDAMQQKMVGILMRSDIPTALNYIDYFESDDKRQQAFDTIIYHWAEQDLSAASDWLSSVDIGNSDAGFSLAQIAVQQNDINIAQKWIKEIKNNYDVDEMHYLIFTQLYQENTDSALDYLNDQTDFSEQEIHTILSSMNSN
ncbi:hypothetical protein [Psychromonas sp. L1A2]|uniref:hypothetical protein n=1 Tax=Psychromonas sp. L1A2 TaxID=2686356 RepID=UPI001F3D7805|nr:hypothetical protein [Psychromonas sp. L1A2]